MSKVDAGQEARGQEAREQDARLAKLAAMVAEPDTSDIPEAPPGTWAQAERGRFHRPRQEAVTISLDADILDWFRRHARGGREHEAAINAALRQFVETQGR